MTVVKSRSPQRPGDVVAEVPAAGPQQVAKAAGQAHEAQAGWWAAAPQVRAAALDSAADAIAADAEALAALIVREVGKPRAEAVGEVARSVAILRYYAQQAFDPVGEVFPSGSASGLRMTRRRPHGVAGLITPWNFPLAIPLWKAAPALAFGNAVLLKPAPEATGCALRLGELLRAHLPEHLLHVLPGDAVAGQAVIGLADIVSFTGSAAVGAGVASAAVARGIPVQCEMGGQNPAIVLADADVPAAAAQIAAAAYGFAGQKCTATKRVIVVGDPDGFTDAFVAATEGVATGDPAADGIACGPLIDATARDRLVAAGAAAASAGGRVLTGGSAIGGDGWFARPTAVDSLPAGHELLREEVFGPICAIVRAASVDEAVEVANDVRYGLTAAVYTRDLDAALRVTDRLAAGQIKVNAPTTGVDFYLPFGGQRDSSYGGREQGKAAAQFYTSLHTITVMPSGRG